MPLVVLGLKADLAALSSSPGADISACAQKWADAMGTYAAGIVPPSTTVSTAKTALKAALTSAFASTVAATTAAAMEVAFLAFATSIGIGMAPTFAGVPPPSSVGFAALFAPPFPISHDAAAQGMSAAIDAWMKTGTATLVAPPNTITTWA